MQRGTRLCALVIVSGSLLGLGAAAGGCDPLGSKGAANRASQALNNFSNALQNATDAAASQSAGWQNTVLKLEERASADLDKHSRQILDQELPRILQIAATVAGPMQADFVSKRVAQHLRQLSAMLLNQPVPPIEPTVCIVTPNPLEIALIGSQQQSLVFSGYDLKQEDDDTLIPTLALLRHDGSKQEYQFVSVQSSYQVTADLSRLPTPLSDEFERIALVIKGKVVSEVPLLKRPPMVNPPIDKSLATGQHLGTTGVRGERRGNVRAFRVPVGTRIESIRACSGTWVTGIALTYSNGVSQTWGNKDDDRVESISLHSGEYVTNIFVREGRFLDWIEFRTSEGRTLHFGRTDSSGDTTHDLAVEIGRKVVGFDLWFTDGKHPQSEGMSAVTEPVLQ